MDIKTVTVVGANGTMGVNVSAIFAAFGNAKVYMVSRSIEKSASAAQAAVKSVRADSISKKLIPRDYSMLEECISESDLVFESVVENFDIKLSITKQIASCLTKEAIVFSGTSGLSITALAECFTESQRGNYFGVHMFNPPYNMTLCELVVTDYADNEKKIKLQKYLTCVLHRTVIEVKDTPAFLANRIGFQFINEAMQYAEKYKDNGGVDYIDAILGTFTGRAMGPLVTADFVGLDVHKAIVDNVYNNTKDYARSTFILPKFVQTLINEGKKGKKSGGGYYRTEIRSDNSKQLLVYDISSGIYREKNEYIFPFVVNMKKSIKNGDYSNALEELIKNNSNEAEICMHFMLSYILYSLVTVEEVAFNTQAADAAMAMGFNWCPPMAMIEAFSSVTDIRELVKERVEKKIMEQVDVDKLMRNIQKSEYDYRRFFKSSK